MIQSLIFSEYEWQVASMEDQAVNEIVKIDSRGMYYRELNRQIRDAVAAGAKKIHVVNVTGQRYIGSDINELVEITLNGTPGNDLGAFMDNTRIIVNGNVQDGCGNTMDSGEIIVHGRAGDILGLSARGGEIFVRDDVGYRAGIHMKEYKEKKPAIVIGGTAQDFFGEYMAGGTLVLLGLTLDVDVMHHTNYIGTGMHSGVIYIRGSFEEHQLGKEVGIADLEETDYKILSYYVGKYAGYFGYDVAELMNSSFTKLYPRWLRPYGRLYTY